MSSLRHHRQSTLRIGAALLALVFLLGVVTGCGDDEAKTKSSDSKKSDDSKSSSSSSDDNDSGSDDGDTTETTAPNTGDVVNRKICETVYHGGFQIQVTSVAFIPENPTEYLDPSAVEEDDAIDCDEPETIGSSSSSASGDEDATTTTEATEEDEDETTTTKKGSSSGKSSTISSPTNGALRVFVKLLNLTDNPLQYYPTVVLSSDEADVTGSSTSDQIPAGGKNDASMDFAGLEEFTFDGVSIIIGSGTENQVSVPLDGKGDVVDQAPISQTLAADSALVYTGGGSLAAKLTNAELAPWDENGYPTEKEKMRLILTWTGVETSDLGCVCQSIYTTTLTTPNGNAVSGTRVDGDSFSPGENAESTLAFDVDTPVGGDYKLDYTMTQNSEDTGSFTFTID